MDRARLAPTLFLLAVALAAGPVRAGDSEAAANPYDVPAGLTQAPYGDAMPAIVKNYLRAAPYVGTGGTIEEGAFGALASLGFKTVIDLRTPEEGAAAEGGPAEAAGLTYVNIPIAKGEPQAGQIESFAELVEDPFNYPILVHCRSANRVGALWALYRARAGVPPEIAVQEGRTVGLKPGREKAVRALLALPPLEG